MTKAARKGVHVTGSKGAYKIQPWIEHPPWCNCSKCAALPIAERGKSHGYRIKRASMHPDDFAASARYAREVKASEEQRLVTAGAGWMSARPDEITVAQLAQAYGDAHPSNRRDLQILRLHLVPFFGAMVAANLKPADVRRYQRHRLAEGASGDTVDREWNTLRAVLNFGESEERIERNPIRRRAVTKVGEGKPREEFFEPEEWWRFMAAFDDEAAYMAMLEQERATRAPRIVNGVNLGHGTRRPDSAASRRRFARMRELKPFFRDLLFACARLGELQSLREKGLDRRRGLATLQLDKTRKRGKKTKTIPIAAPWMAHLNEIPRRMPEALVYVRASGKPIGQMEARRTFRLALQLARIDKNLTPHSIRHTALTWLGTAGVPKAQRDELAGHARATVGDGYVHLSDRSLVPVVAVLARIEENGFTATERAAEAYESGT